MPPRCGLCDTGKESSGRPKKAAPNLGFSVSSSLRGQRHRASSTLNTFHTTSTHSLDPQSRPRTPVAEAKAAVIKGIQ